MKNDTWHNHSNPSRITLFVLEYLAKHKIPVIPHPLCLLILTLVISSSHLDWKLNLEEGDLTA
jgi:hypothetical protein